MEYGAVSSSCLFDMQEASNVTSGKSKSVAYTEITSNFRPVFHHFFMEHFPTPPQWFERSLAYTRSVAASSMGQCSCVDALHISVSIMLQKKKY